MNFDVRWTMRAAATFALAGAILAGMMIISYSTRAPPVGSPAFYVELFLFAVVFSAFVGGFWWIFLVERLNWLSFPIRGALTGFLTGWLSVTLLIPVVTVTGQLNGLLASNEGATQELASMVLTSALAATFYFGPFATFPVGVFIGYLLGRRRALESGE